MPLPSEPIVLRGGCSCSAVRWRMNLPEASKRALNPYHTPGVDIGDVRLPTAVMCHCNSCRRTTGALGAYGFTTDMATLELSILPRTTVPDQEKERDDAARVPYVPASDFFDAPERDISGLWVSHLESSPGRHRWFCGRCGTQLVMAPAKESIPPEMRDPRILNLFAATTDRDLLENDWCRPDHVMNCSIAIPWVRDHVKNGTKDTPEHPWIFMDWKMSDDFRPHIEMLKQHGLGLDVTMWD